MKVKLYVDWREEKILKEKEYEKEILEAVEEQEEDEYRFNEFLDNYLSQRCHRYEFEYLFNISGEERKEILELWKKDCYETVKADFDDDYEEIELEL